MSGVSASPPPTSVTCRELPISDIAIEQCGVYLPDHSRYQHLLNLPEEQNIAKAIKKAMASIEEYKPELEGILPKDEYDRLVHNEQTSPPQKTKKPEKGKETALNGNCLRINLFATSLKDSGELSVESLNIQFPPSMQ